MAIENLSIVAVGGGGPLTPVREHLIHAVDMAGVEGRTPNILVIPTARPDQATHDATINKTKTLYEEQHGLNFEVLHDFESLPKLPEIEEKIEWADVLYIAGGDTEKMISIWDKSGISKKLSEQALKGLVFSGISAGAIAPFSWGHSDSLSYRVGPDEPWDYMKVRALGLVAAGITPHYNSEAQGRPRSESFFDMFSNEPNGSVGFGIENKAALVIYEGILKILSVDPSETVEILMKRSGEVERARLSIGHEQALAVI
jgi:dipeptidase E